MKPGELTRDDFFSNPPLLLKQAEGRRTLSLAEQIAEQVGKTILNDQLKPGEAITEQNLSDQFEVSRGPVREALRILEREGLVEIIPRRGARVSQLTVREVSEIFDVRAVLLGHAARLAAQRRDAECLRVLREGYELLAKNLEGDSDLTLHFEVSAHMNYTLVARSGNEKLFEIVYHLARQVARYTRLGLSTPENRAYSVETWKELILLIEAGMDDEADTLERQRVRRVQATAVRMLSDTS